MHDNESGRKVFDIWPKVCIDHSTNKKAISMDEALQKIGKSENLANILFVLLGITNLI